MKYVYIAGPLFDDHERQYLEEIALVLENNEFETFLPHRDAGLVEGEFTNKLREDIFTTDIEALEKEIDVLEALLKPKSAEKVRYLDGIPSSVYRRPCKKGTWNYINYKPKRPRRFLPHKDFGEIQLTLASNSSYICFRNTLPGPNFPFHNHSGG